MGLDVYMEGVPEGNKFPEESTDEAWEEYEKNKTKSALHPEHLWSPVYLRSSYNESGFNSVVPPLSGGQDLYTIFGPIDEDLEGYFWPNWEVALNRAQSLYVLLGEKIKNFPYRCTPVTSEDLRPQDGIIDSAEKALAYFEKELQREPPFDSYGNAKGEFFMKEPLATSALIRGKDYIGMPCLYLVYKDAGLKWYLEALEILVKEFIPLGIKHKETAYLIWSN